jgi:hypothetical protein
MPRKNKHAVALGRRGGKVSSPAKTASSTANARQPRPGAQRYRMIGKGLERRVDGQWRTLEPPYDAAAKAWLYRHR